MARAAYDAARELSVWGTLARLQLNAWAKLALAAYDVARELYVWAKLARAGDNFAQQLHVWTHPCYVDNYVDKTMRRDFW